MTVPENLLLTTGTLTLLLLLSCRSFCMALIIHRTCSGFLPEFMEIPQTKDLISKSSWIFKMNKWHESLHPGSFFFFNLKEVSNDYFIILDLCFYTVWKIFGSNKGRVFFSIVIITFWLRKQDKGMDFV